MALHIDEVAVTRDALLHRYANAMPEAVTYGFAADQLAGYSLDSLRDLVESVENRQRVTMGRRRSFARSLPTTSLRGQTR